ncbi:hypothetical protein HZC31_04555 [Candidatus Woesearchaeota archaeon]|nr:hypothetical protein [Candidatus Woesearchaeota archaeon]
MGLLEEAPSLDDFFTGVLTPALQKRGVSLSPDAREHVVSVLVRYASKRGEIDDVVSHDAAVPASDPVYIQETYLAAQRSPVRLLSLADTCLLRQGFFYAHVYDRRRNFRSPSEHTHFGSASYARVAQLLLDSQLPDVASPFIELAGNFDPLTRALADVHLASLTDQQLLQLYDRMLEVRDARYRQLFEENGIEVIAPKASSPEKGTDRTKLYIPALGSHDNN